MGRHPFEKPESAEELLKLQQHGAPVRPSAWRKGLPEEADRVIQRALSYDPAQRYQSARKFSDDLAWALFKAKPKTQPGSVRAWVVVAAALLVVLSITLWLASKKKPADKTAPPVAEGKSRQLTFGLNIVRARDGKRTRATGREMFDTGDTFKFDFTPGEPGALYVFNEGGSGNWHVLFPTCENNRLDARLTSDRGFATEDYMFTNRSGREKGAEKIWFVWSAARIEVLDEIVRQSARGCPKPCDGCMTVGDSAQRELLSRFMSEHGTPRPEVRFDKEQARTTLEGLDGILVHSLDLEHTDWK